jgi:FHA domain-containing protein
MQHRYALRFENGERRGELVALTGTGTTFGRRPGNGVQILDASVSGRHAEVVLDEKGVLLRDLGSTNGTRIGTERVSERRLAHGDEVLFGNVRLTFIDGSIDPNPPGASADQLASAPVAAAPEAAGEGMRTISADMLARSSKRSLVAAFVVLLLLGGAGAAWFFLGRSSSEGAAPSRPVESVAGNLLGASSAFELEPRTGSGTAAADAWQSTGAAPAAFSVERSGRHSGATGLRADLEAGQWAEQRSPEVNLRGSKALRARAFVSGSAGARARVGVALESSTGKLAPLEVWSQPVAGSEELQELAFAFALPPSYDRARAVILASASASAGVAMADDASLVEEAAVPAGSVLAHEDQQLFLFGTPAQSALLFKLDHPVLRLAVEAAPGAEATPPVDPWSGMEVASQPNGFRLQPAPNTSAHSLAIGIEDALLAQGLATLGSGGADGGYRTHQTEFERAGVRSILAGAGRDLTRIAFDAPVTVRGRPTESGFRLEADLAAGAGASLQLVFKEERAQAEAFAREAREATKQGQLGTALGAWARLLDEVPFEAALVREAETARAQLVEKGLEEVQKLRLEIERARFFRLVDLYRQCARAAQACADRYQKSEVETQAKAVLASIDQDLSSLEKDLDQVEARRLASIHRALLAQKMPHLAERVAEALRKQFGVEDPASLSSTSNP